MSKKNYYEVDMEFEDEDIIKQSVAERRDLEQTLGRFKRRERIYYGLMGAVLIAAVGFGFQYSISAEEPAIAFQRGSGYTQDLGLVTTGYDTTGSANNPPTAGGGGCGGGAGASAGAGGGGCCGGGGGSGAGAAQVDLNALAKELKAFYSKATGTPETEFEAVVADRGCHTQGDISVNGQIVQSYAYRNGTFEPIN